MVVIIILCAIVAVFSLAGIIWSVKNLKGSLMRNISIGTLLLSLIGIGVILSFSDVAKGIEIIDLDEKYVVDESGIALINGKYEHVENYKNIRIEVQENGKKLSENEVVATVKPSSNTFSVTYNLPSYKSETKLNILLIEGSKVVNTEVLIQRGENTPKASSTLASTQESTVDTSTTDSSKKENVFEMPSEGKSSKEREPTFDIFNSIKEDTIERFNTEVKPEYKISIKEIKISEDEKSIEIFVDNTILDIKRERQEEFLDEVGKRVIGLYRGSVTAGNDTEDLPLKVMVDENKLFAESKKDDAMMLEIVYKKD